MSKNQIISTAEPFFIPGGKIGCLLIHGFTGTPKEMRMLGDSLALENYTVLAPRLAGHATSPEDLSRMHWMDWVASVEDALTLLKACTETQIVMGLSMGGVLSMITAARYDVKAVVTFSAPAALPGDPRAKYLPYISWAMKKVEKGTPDWKNPDAIKDHVDYPYYPVKAILQLKNLIDVMHQDLAKVTVPAFMVQSHGDHGIPEDSMNVLYDNISSKDKTKMWVENSGHVVIREPDRELIFSSVKQFIHRITL